MTHRKLLGLLLICVSSVAAGAWILPRFDNLQTALQRTIPDYLVSLQLETWPADIAPISNDQITVLFSNRSAPAGTVAPQPLFGEDIIQEFSVSGWDIGASPRRITRRVRDKSFVDARWIRVINHGAVAWNAEKIWLTVDGEVILNGVPMAPHTIGAGGLRNFNRGRWSQRVYWEMELQQFRKRSAR